MNSKRVQSIAALLLVSVGCASSRLKIIDETSKDRLAAIIVPDVARGPKSISIWNAALCLQLPLAEIQDKIVVEIRPEVLSLTITNDWPAMRDRRHNALQYCEMLSANKGIAVTMTKHRIIIHGVGTSAQPFAGADRREDGASGRR